MGSGLWIVERTDVVLAAAGEVVVAGYFNFRLWSGVWSIMTQEGNTFWMWQHILDSQSSM